MEMYAVCPHPVYSYRPKKRKKLEENHPPREYAEVKKKKEPKEEIGEFCGSAFSAAPERKAQFLTSGNERTNERR